MEVYQGETDMDARLTQTTALTAINRHIPKDACVIGAAGSLPGCMQRMWRAHTQDTYNRNTVIPAWAMKSPSRWA